MEVTDEMHMQHVINDPCLCFRQLGFDDDQGRIKGSTDPFGPDYLDYVSDSQLNTIPLT